MHRSGTSAVTGLLAQCGAWPGESDELTSANVENPWGFWERRDVRGVCDRLLHAAGAEWWKVAGFDVRRIPHAVLKEERSGFASVLSELSTHGQWVIKEPRLCLLLPALRDYLDEAACVLVVRNPCEVALSLKLRNGFSLYSGLLLWEAYNRHALVSTRHMHRVILSYDAVMENPGIAMKGVIERLNAHFMTGLDTPDSLDLGQYINPFFHHHRESDAAARRMLTPSQRDLWSYLQAGEPDQVELGEVVSEELNEALLDFQSTESSLRYYQERARERESAYQRSERMVSNLRAQRDRLNGELARRNGAIEMRDRRVSALQAERDRRVSVLQAEIAERERTINGLQASFSWRFTLPLRMARRARDRVARRIRQALGRGKGRGVRRQRRSTRAEAKRSTPTQGEAKDGESGRIVHRMHRLAEDARSRHVETRKTSIAGTQHAPGTRPLVSVIAWSGGHNAVGRAYLLAEALSRDFDVEIIASCFPRHGEDVWKPLRACSRVTIKTFEGTRFPRHFGRMEHVAKEIKGDLLYVSKARLPSMELGILAKEARSRPLLLDVDDYELGFFTRRSPLTLEEIDARPRSLSFLNPYHELWTRYAEGLIPLFDDLTVANEVLQSRYGGAILPHLRDEYLFAPHLYPRERAREILGFHSDDKVIVFAGTPRLHKGVGRIAEALETLRGEQYKFLLVGSPPDDVLLGLFSALDEDQVRAVPDVQFFDLPAYLRAADLVCLLQDPAHVTSLYQSPAKLTDALAMELPVLATPVPPLERLIAEGFIEAVGGEPLGPRIAAIFDDLDQYREKARRSRECFIHEYSYGAKRALLREVVRRHLDNPKPQPEEFQRLLEFHRKEFGGGARGAPLPVRVRRPNAPENVDVAGKEVDGFPIRRCREDTQVDVVVFWKQNDSGMYGRRHDMLVKYMSKLPRVRRVLLVDAPIGLGRLARMAMALGDRIAKVKSHDRQLALRILQCAMGRESTEVVRRDVYLFVTKRRVPGWLRRWIPSESGYLDYLSRAMRRHGIGSLPTVYWVCPRNFHFPAIRERFRPDLVVADVIDDHREWPHVTRHYRSALSRNYEEILRQSDLVVANCEPVVRAMRLYCDTVHLVSNGADPRDTDTSRGPMPRVLRRIKGPVVGYVGNLDSARLDMHLLEFIARERPQWTLVLIGSMHQSAEIRVLEQFRNVRFLGPLAYDDALAHMEWFSVGMLPHLDNGMTRHMSPLKVYVYLSAGLPVVSTRVGNMEQFASLVRIGDTREAFVKEVEACLAEGGTQRWHEERKRFLRANSWERRVEQVWSLIETKLSPTGRETGTRSELDVGMVEREEHPSSYCEECTVCGANGVLKHVGGSIRESYRCSKCGASLRYRDQARVIVDVYSRNGAKCLKALCEEPLFRSLRIYEPGSIGPFRPILRNLPGYTSSEFWGDVAPGEWKEGRYDRTTWSRIARGRTSTQCQDLMQLTYPNDSFDLVLTSDILEHVRRPFVAFGEIDRVLKPGGFHVFSIPVLRPMAMHTRARVDTSGREDVPIVPKHYHSAPGGGRSLVYTDFGLDMGEILATRGIALRIEGPETGCSPESIKKKMVTLHWTKGDRRGSTDLTDGVDSDEWVSESPCNLCGTFRFRSEPGVEGIEGKRRGVCCRCGSREWHRVVRQVWNCFPRELLRKRAVLRINDDRSVEEEWFGSLEMRIVEQESSVADALTGAKSGAYDAVICNQVLTADGRGRSELEKILALLASGGFVQLTVRRGPLVNGGGGGHNEVGDGADRTGAEGREVVRMFLGEMQGVGFLEVAGTDAVTGGPDCVYFVASGSDVLDQMEECLKGYDGRLHRDSNLPLIPGDLC